MSTNTITRKKHKGLPGNGGEFTTPIRESDDLVGLNPIGRPVDVAALKPYEKIDVARDVRTDPATLRELYRTGVPMVRQRVLENVNTPEDVIQNADYKDLSMLSGELNYIKRLPDATLDRLSTDKYETVRADVAEHPCASAGTLSRLARDEKDSVRGYVTRNPNTDSATLDRLAHDKNPWVRAGVAGNPNARSQTLMTLASDEDDRVLYQIAVNPNSPKRALMSIARSERFGAEIAQNPSVSSAILDVLSTSSDWRTRAEVAKSRYTAEETLDEMGYDLSDSVRRRVESNPFASAEIKERIKATDMERAEIRAEIRADIERDMSGWSEYEEEIW